MKRAINVVNTNIQRLTTVERRLPENSGDSAKFLTESILAADGDGLIEVAIKCNKQKRSGALEAIIKRKINERLSDHDPENPKIRALKNEVARQLFAFLNETKVIS